MEEKKYFMDAESAGQKMHRMGLEIAEHLSGNDAPVVLIGVRNSGSVVAEIVAAHARNYLSNEISVLSVLLDKHNPTSVQLSSEMDLNGVNVIVVDDVCNTGKTLLYSMKPLLQFHPRSIQTLVLVERMHKLFPVKPDYVGSSIATTADDFIKVETENGVVMCAYIE